MSPAGSYYFADDPNHKTRIVVLNLYDVPTEETTPSGKAKYNKMTMIGLREEELNWFANVALDVPSKDWTVVLFTHALWRDFHAPDNCILTDKNKQIINRILQIKRESAATLAFWITGHIHKDCYDILSDGQTELQIISTTSDGYAYSFAPNGLRMRPGTDREQCIDCMQMDVKNRTIHFTRIGAGEDRVYQY
jgi:hypothetical protein